jgi:glyoxylase-like metal-dependent hydrolase (beta-lactamase superfamily II)
MDISPRDDFDPHVGKPVAVAPGVLRVTADNPGPFTFRGTNSFLIGDSDLVLLDPGPADPRHLEALVAAARGRPVVMIIVSHSHSDHCAGANQARTRFAAPILAAATPSHADAAAGRLDAAAEGDFAPDQAIGDGATIEVPGHRLQAIATPGHAPDHLAFALAGTGLLFSGDHVMGWATTVVAPPEGSMADYMRSLDCLLDRPEAVYLPAHGGAIADAHAHVRALKAHRNLRERAILERLNEGDRTIAEIVRRVYAGLDQRLERAASLSTLAHLEHLIVKGKARSNGPPALTARFEPFQPAG